MEDNTKKTERVTGNSNRVTVSNGTDDLEISKQGSEFMLNWSHYTHNRTNLYSDQEMFIKKEELKTLIEKLTKLIS